MKTEMSKETKSLIDSYKTLAYLTGRIEFFMAYRYIENTNTPFYLEEKTEEQELSI